MPVKSSSGVLSREVLDEHKFPIMQSIRTTVQRYPYKSLLDTKHLTISNSILFFLFTTPLCCGVYG
jgi:hypothetical protein